ncbi:transmembrane protein 130 isoform X1 [Dendrobates tinctorius]|uniref:transmembrane protein 130 isoform X1 n=1 Tax=Dendrobates tinctorius TaxID=92724 RepID=UPI003CC9D598
MASSSFTPMIHCLLFLTAATFGYESYFLMVSSDGPITSGAEATVNASLLIANGSSSLIADPGLYHFHWIYNPLRLTHRSQGESSSAITLQCESPGSYPISVRVTERHCSTCDPIARNTTELQVTRGIVGRLTASQADGNGTHERSGFVLATDTTVTLSFLIHDPSDFFKSAALTYKWVFDGRTTVLTSDPFVHHNYSSPGNFKVSLLVTAYLHDANYQRHPERKIGNFTAMLTLQDVISSIAITGPRETTTRQNISRSLHIFGRLLTYIPPSKSYEVCHSLGAFRCIRQKTPITETDLFIPLKQIVQTTAKKKMGILTDSHPGPPLTVCWLIKSDCVSLDGEECHPLVINGTAVIIKHHFRYAGRYCLSVKAQNEVSKLLGHQSITVTNEGVHPVWFVLPCCAFIAIAIGFIFYTLFRAGSHSPHQKSLVEVADFDFSPVNEKYEALPEYKEIPARNVCCSYCTADSSSEDGEQRGETQPLLHASDTPTRSYTL